MQRVAIPATALTPGKQALDSDHNIFVLIATNQSGFHW